jgi:hypothetical protein
LYNFILILFRVSFGLNTLLTRIMPVFQIAIEFVRSRKISNFLNS